MMAKNWFVKRKGKIFGPASRTQLEQLASAGKITRETEVRLGEDGEWVSAASVQGLWTHVAKTKTTIEQIAAEVALGEPPAPVPATVQPFHHSYPTTTPTRETPPLAPATSPEAQFELPATHSSLAQKACMFCGEMIARTAIKCRYCGEFLDGRPREAEQQAPQVVVPQNVVSHDLGYHRPIVIAQSSALGGLLSLLVPGMGQLCTGRPLAGIFWFIVTIIGYAAFIIPGLLLHLICIVDASKVKGIRIG